jgi:hypothetical protein
MVVLQRSKNTGDAIIDTSPERLDKQTLEFQKKAWKGAYRVG